MKGLGALLPTFGELTTALLIIALFSGFIVNYQYELTDPFISTVAIETVLPFGAFWRALHFWSGQLFFLTLLYHGLDKIWNPQTFSKRLSPKMHWSIMSLTLPCAILILFTGYVLRFDATGRAASSIFEHLLTSIPLIGTALNRILASINNEGLNRIYIIHILLTCLLWGIGTWYHTRKVILSAFSFFIASIISLIIASIINAPIDLPGQKVHLIKGPWFFLGIQELLRYMPPLIAGVIFPAIPIILLSSLSWIKRRLYSYILLLLWTVSYFTLTIIALLR